MTVELIEHQQECLKEAFVDKEAMVIRNVVLLGAVSKNNRIYSSKAMQEATDLYNGIRAFANHPPIGVSTKNARDIRDLIGKFTFPKCEDSKIKADLKLLPTAKWVMDIAENMPGTVGFSHNALGIVVRKDGKEIVEEIKVVKSVDLVTEPATTVTMFESKDEDGKDETEKQNDDNQSVQESGDDKTDEKSEMLEKEEKDSGKNEDKKQIVQKLLEDKKIPKVFITPSIVEIIAKLNTLTEMKDFITEYVKLISITKAPNSSEKDPESLFKKISETTVDDDKFIQVIKKR